MKPCPSCQENVDTLAVSCPACGNEMPTADTGSAEQADTDAANE